MRVLVIARSAFLAAVTTSGVSAAWEPSLGLRRLQDTSLPTCDTPDGFINCTDGEVENGDTCEVACAGKCCGGGSNACDGFTGLVCSDGLSCMGGNACQRATIGRVVDGCKGQQSCLDADIGSVQDGCVGKQTCLGAKNIGSVTNGCKPLDPADERDVGACASAENIGSIENGCLGERACLFAGGAEQGEAGSVGRIVSSCQGARSCKDLGGYSGSVGCVDNSCLAANACSDAGEGVNVSLPFIANICNNVTECAGITDPDDLPPSTGDTICYESPTSAPSKAATTAPSKAKPAPSKSTKAAKADGGAKSAKSQGDGTAKSAKSQEWGGWTNNGGSPAKSAKSHSAAVVTGGSAKSAKSQGWGGWADGGGSSAKSGKAWVCGWSEPVKEGDAWIGGGDDVEDSALADILLGLVTDALKNAKPDDVAMALEAVVGVVGGV